MDDELLLRFERCGVLRRRVLDLPSLLSRPGLLRQQVPVAGACCTGGRPRALDTSGQPLGRADHRDRNRELRLRKRAATCSSVMDQGSENVALARSVCPPQGPFASMDDVGEGPMAGAPMTIRPDCNPEDELALDESSDSPRRRRGVEGCLAEPVVATASASAADAPRSGALWYQSPVHAVLCATEEESWSRLGLVDEFLFGVDNGPLHSRASRARASPRPAHRRPGVASTTCASSCSEVSDEEHTRARGGDRASALRRALARRDNRDAARCAP